jgi:hypothetical protein
MAGGTSGCVRASAMDALNFGFRPQVVRQACADRAEALHEANLADLDAKYADVVDLSEALDHGNPRDMSQAVAQLREWSVQPRRSEDQRCLLSSVLARGRSRGAPGVVS